MTTSNHSPAAQPAPDRIAYWADRLVLGVARHWLALFSLALFLYVGVPFLAPVLMKLGLTTPARIIYTIYMPACHQLPDRSYFLFGEKPVYTLSELEADNVLPGTSILERRRYIGDETLGWKVALCERDVAIWGSMFLLGFVFLLLGRRVRPLSMWGFALFLVPIAVDGLSQLVGLRTSTWWLRTITGALFGTGIVWLAYPHIEIAMREIRQSTEKKLARQN